MVFNIVLFFCFITRHPKFDGRWERPGGGRPRYDLTLIKLKDKLDLNGKHSQLTPICLPNSGVTEKELLQSYCTVSGWGGRQANYSCNINHNFILITRFISLIHKGEIEYYLIFLLGQFYRISLKQPFHTSSTDRERHS